MLLIRRSWCGKDKAEYDLNLEKFLDAARKYSLTVNQSTCKFSTNKIKFLDFLIGDKTIMPDPDHLQPLLNLPPPNDTKTLKRAIGLFANYSRLVKDFSGKIHNLVHFSGFQLFPRALDVFEILKKEIASAAMSSIDESSPCTIQTDASDFAIAATLSQDGKPVVQSSLFKNFEQRRNNAFIHSKRSLCHYSLLRNGNTT